MRHLKAVNPLCLNDDLDELASVVDTSLDSMSDRDDRSAGRITQSLHEIAQTPGEILKYRVGEVPSAFRKVARRSGVLR